MNRVPWTHQGSRYLLHCLGCSGVGRRCYGKAKRSPSSGAALIAGALPAAGQLGREAPGTAVEGRLAPEVCLIGDFPLELRCLGRLAGPKVATLGCLRHNVQLQMHVSTSPGS